MKKVFLLLFILGAACYAQEYRMITPVEREQVYKIGRSNGVPLSVVKQLMQEESGGYVDIPSKVAVNGWYSRGLFQIYERPDYLAWLLWKFWTKADGVFNINDPIDNATLSMRYLAWLHGRFGNWYESLLFYNHGDIRGCSIETKNYARRIVNAK